MVFYDLGVVERRRGLIGCGRRRSVENYMFDNVDDARVRNSRFFLRIDGRSTNYGRFKKRELF